MSLLDIIGGDYGQTIQLTFIDVDTDAAADISGYGGVKEMIFTRPDNTVVAKTATFASDGTDGVIQYVVEADFLVAGSWRVRGRAASGSARLTTVEHSFRVKS